MTSWSSCERSRRGVVTVGCDTFRSATKSLIRGVWPAVLTSSARPPCRPYIRPQSRSPGWNGTDHKKPIHCSEISRDALYIRSNGQCDHRGECLFFRPKELPLSCQFDLLCVGVHHDGDLLGLAALSIPMREVHHWFVRTRHFGTR